MLQQGEKLRGVFHSFSFKSMEGVLEVGSQNV